jgi:predicted small secreted protein
MKLIYATLLVLAMLATGCQTPAGGRDISGAIRAAAFTGTALALRDHPEWRKGFEEAEVIDFPLVLAIVQRLPVSELRSSDAAIIITGATILLSDFNSSIPLDQIEKLRPVVSALRQGITLVVGTSPSSFYTRKL